MVYQFINNTNIHLMNLPRSIFLVILLCFNISCNNENDLLKADTDNGGLILPEGFSALVVIDSVGGSRHLAVNENGDIYVKLKTPMGSLGNVALRDNTGDGKADVVERFGDYPNDGAFATEMRIHKGYLYFSSELVVYRQKLTRGKLIPQGKPEVILRDKFPIRWHNAKSLAFDKKGGMYVTFSAPTNVCEDWNTVEGESVENVKGFFPCPELLDFAGIWRFDEAKPNQWQHDGILYATGLRSIVGISWNDETDKLYAVLHGRDYLHGHDPKNYSEWQNAVLPAEEFLEINKGEDFGWPYTYYDQYKKSRVIAPEYVNAGIQSADQYALPLMGLPAHWAPNDLLFYKGDQFPDRYKNGAFIAFHGSTNRGPYPQGGYIVVFIPMTKGKPSGDWEVFADGFAQVDTIFQMQDAKYRPMGLAEGPDGSLYISDSKFGKIWRVMYQKNKSEFGPNQLKKMELLKTKTYIKEPDKVKDLLPKKDSIK